MKLIEPDQLPYQTELRQRQPFVLGVDEVERPVVLKPTQIKQTEKKSFEQQIMALALLFVLSMASYYLISRFCISTVQVSGRSMTPTLHDGERYVLNRLSFLYRDPQIGEIVVLRDPGHSDFAVKRIIAGPADSISFKNGKVFVNGNEIRESYLSSSTRTLVPATRPKDVVLGKDQYFVLGDNRFGSEDSRYYGAIKRAQIVGPIWK
ncbi:MAG: lepB [Verrucomicrobiales bacterium]|nr:lepB [Verrucomicrobiales bacterium]